MNLQEQISRIKSMMGLLVENENEAAKGPNHGKVIKQPYQEGQEGEKLHSYRIGVTHFNKQNPLYLKKEDINPIVIDEIKKVAENCGYYYEGNGGPDLINIKNFFKNELGLNNVKKMGSYEPKIDNKAPSEDKRMFMYTFFSNGNSKDEEGNPQDGINQDGILLDELNKLNQQGTQIRTIEDLILNGDSRKMFWDGSLSFNTDDIRWFFNQIKETPNTDEIITLLGTQPTKENIRKFIQSGFDVMWGNFETKSDNHGYKEGKNLLTNMAENAVQVRRNYIKKNLVCGIYFIGEGHIKSWAEQFEDTEII